MSNRERLDSYLKQARNRLRLSVVLRGGAVLAATALAATVILVLIANALAFSPTSLAVARIVLFAALAIALIFGVLLPLRALNRRRAARRAEAVFPQFQQRLITFVDRDAEGREPFIELLAADTLELARGAEPAKLAPRSKLLAALAGCLCCLGVLIWLVAAGPGYFGYGAARLWTGSRPNVAAFYDIHIRPGNAAVRRNASETITAHLVGFASPGARLFARYRSTSQWEAAAMQPQPGGSGFQFVFVALPESVEYYVEAGRVRSRRFDIRVVDLPAVKQIRVTYHYPAWTGLHDALEEQGGDLRAVEGAAADVALRMDRPMAGGRLVLNSGREIALSSGARNIYQGTIRIEKDGAYHVAALDHGQLVRLSDDFLIEASKAKPPEVSITRPAGDYQASPIEEVTVFVRAADDYGLRAAGLHYSVNGGPDRSVNLLKRPGAKQMDASTVLALENFKLVPGDVVSFYATAKDGRTESHSDMFFIEAQPFEREYSQSQLAGTGGMGGGQQGEISRREKEIIAATWKQQVDGPAARQQAAGTGTFLSSAQDKLRSQALSLAGRLQARDLTFENDAFSEFQRDMSAAADAMAPASKRLRQQKWKDALPNEEKALDQLLRAEATFRRIQVAFGSQGGGGGARAGRDLADLFNLELDTEKNQYESGQTAEAAKQRAQQLDKTLQKLDELARREQQMARQRNNTAQKFQQRWQQEILRRQAEQLQKELEQLAQANSQLQHASSQPGGSASASEAGNGASQAAAGEQLARALEKIHQASADMRRAAAQGASAADARRAASSLAEASKLLSGLERRQSSGKLDSLARDADRLASEEHNQQARIRQMFGGQNQSESGQIRFDGGSQQESKLADERQLLAADLSRLESAMRDSARQLGAAEPDAASKLRQTLGEMDRSDLENRLERSAQSIRMGMNPGSNTVEPAISAGMDRMRAGIDQAQRALKPQAGNPAEEELARVEQLRREIQALTSTAGGARSGRAGEQASGGQAQQSQQGGAGQGRQSGQGDRSGQASQAGQGSQQADSNGGFESGGPGGPRVWRGRRGPGIGAYIQGPGGGNEAASPAAPPDELALRDAMRQLDGLRRELRSSPESASAINQVMRDLERLEPGKFGANPEITQQLSAQALAGVDRIELQLRRKLDNQGSNQVRNGDVLPVPAGYQESVAEYFRRLSKNR
ncbi:MAG: hypothetical protein ACRD3D_16680 [Terriglobia bacterium]